MVYELFVVAGNIQNGNRLIHLTDSNPFMGFDAGQFIDLPSGQRLPIREVHHSFAPVPGSAPPQTIHRIALLV